MELSGERVIRASQARIYDALHDPVVLRQIVPGCQSLTKREDGGSQVASVVKVGPLKAHLSTTVELFNEDKPAGYSLYAVTEGGPAGNGAGTVHIALAPIDSETTNLAYHATGYVDGRLAELGEPVLEETARTLAAELFSRLELFLDNPDAVSTAPAAAVEPHGAQFADAATTGAAVSRQPSGGAGGSGATAPYPAREPRAMETAASTTDETGAFVSAAPPPREMSATAEAGPELAAGDARERRVSEGVWRTDFQQHSRDEPVRMTDRPESKGALKRWLLVLVGLGVIAFLLGGL